MGACDFKATGPRNLKKGQEGEYILLPPVAWPCQVRYYVDDHEIRPGETVGGLEMTHAGGGGDFRLKAHVDRPQVTVRVVKTCPESDESKGCSRSVDLLLGEIVDIGIDRRLQGKRHRRRGRLHRKDDDCDCAIIFWQGGSLDQGGMSGLIEVVSGFSNTSHVSVDCCLYDEDGVHYMIESTVQVFLPEWQNDPIELDGPQYSPIGVYGTRPFLRVPIGHLIDCAKFCKCLREHVENEKIHHKTQGHWVHLVFGSDEPDYVTCSGFIARCIEHQPGSELARRLRHALDGRLIGGEVTPSDLERALGIDDANTPFHHGPPH